jgi:RNA polymerase sigma factor (sigma-70 family)
LKYEQKTDNQLTDIALWNAFKQGDKTAFVQIYETYTRVLLVYGSRIWKNEEAVRDTVQDLFIDLWKSRERLSATDNIKIYLFQALRYKLLRQKTQLETADIKDFEAAFAENSHEIFLIEAEHTSEQIQKLQKAIEQLPARQQEALHLRYYQDCSHEEMAQIMGIHYQSVSNIIHKALSALKQHFKDSFLLLGLLLANPC